MGLTDWSTWAWVRVSDGPSAIVPRQIAVTCWDLRLADGTGARVSILHVTRMPPGKVTGNTKKRIISSGDEQEMSNALFQRVPGAIRTDDPLRGSGGGI